MSLYRQKVLKDVKKASIFSQRTDAVISHSQIYRVALRKRSLFKSILN